MQDNRTEHWLPVVGYEGLYEVSDRGRVRSLGIRRGRFSGTIMWQGKPSPGSPYPRVQLCREGRPKFYRVHVLVLRAFIGPRPPGYEIDHVNGDKTDNRVVNLEYVPPTINNRRARAQGLYRQARGERIWSARLNEDDVRAIRTLYARGHTQGAIGALFGISDHQVSNIVRGKNWPHVD